MAHRYFTSEIEGGFARLLGPDALHLQKVLRAKEGQKVYLCDGNNTDYEAEITGFGKEEIILKILDSRPSVAEPDIWVELYLGYAKGERMDWAIQKAVELGASSIVPFFSRYCVVKPKKEEEKATRFNRIAAEAAKQCGRGILPRVEMPVSFKEVVARAASFDLALFLYERQGTALRQVIGKEKKTAIITGPEGGFSEEEADRALQAGCKGIYLGPRILRSETAPAAVLASYMTLTGNLE